VTEKHDVELKLANAKAEIQSYVDVCLLYYFFSYLQAVAQRSEMENKMTEMVNLMMVQNPESKKEYIDSKGEENARHRYELRQKVCEVSPPTHL
jgi:hypothetical protein